MDRDSDQNFYLKLQALTEDFRSTEIPISKKLLNIKNFVQCIQEFTPPLEVEDIDDLLESIEPTDFSAKRLKLELANKFLRPLIILEYIKKEEKFLTQRALQFSWIFNENHYSPLTNPKTLVRVILPNVSYCTRSKIISGLSKNFQNEKSCEEMFTLISDKYGYKCALNLLPACSVEFIQTFFKNNPSTFIMLTRAQSLQIAKKDHLTALEFLTSALEYQKSLVTDPDDEDESSNQDLKKARNSQGKLSLRLRMNHLCTFQYLCLNFPREFLELYEKYKDFIPFLAKPQSTKVLMATSQCKELILSNGTKYRSILHLNTLPKCISLQEFTTFFSSLLSTTMEHFHTEHEKLMKTWLNPFPPPKRWKILKDSFKMKYDKDLLSNPGYISAIVVKIMPEDLREEVIAIKVKNNDPGRVSHLSWESLPLHRKGFWYSFLPVEKSIPKIKDLLAHESCPNTRAELLTFLLNACEIGKDIKALVNVCKFVLAKYRNDDYLVRTRFLTELNSKFKLNTLLDNSELWETLIEFIKLSSAYGEQEETLLIQGAIRYRLLHNLPVEDLKSNFAKVISLSSSHWIGEWPRYSGNPDVEKKFFKFFIQEIEKLYPDGKDNDEMIRILINLLHTISDWKRKEHKAFTKNFSLKDYPWLSSKLLNPSTISEVNDRDLLSKILKIIRSDETIMMSYFQKVLISDPHGPILDLCLKIDPPEIFANLEVILIFMLSMDSRDFVCYHRFLKHLKTQSFPEIASTIIEICLETVQDEGRDNLERRNALVILSYLWDSTNYLHTTTLFIPASPTIDLMDEEFESRYDVKKAVVQSLKNTSYPNQCLGPVSQFCVGDYVKISVGPLNSACKHSPHQEAITFLKEDLLDSPVSLKKHVIRLLCTLSDLDEVEELLIYLWENETHPSIREILISQMCAFISSHPDKDKGWLLIKNSMMSLTLQKAQKDTLNLLQEYFLPHNRANIPESLLSEYFSISYIIISNDDGATSIQKEGDGDEDANLRNSLFQYFIEILTQNIDFVSDDFLKSIIEQNLFKVRERSNLVVSLSIKWLFKSINDKSKMETQLQILTSKLLKLKDQWDSKESLPTEKTICLDSYEYIVETISSEYPARKGLSFFVQEVCHQAFNQMKDDIRRDELKEILSRFLDTVKSNFDPGETFTHRLFLELSHVFIDIDDAIQCLPKSTNIERDKATLIKSGQKLQQLTDAILEEYHTAIFSLYYEKLICFCDRVIPQNILEQNGWLFVIRGIVSEIEGGKVSIENQILACKLMQKNRESYIQVYKDEFNELTELFIKSPAIAVKAVLHAEM